MLDNTAKTIATVAVWTSFTIVMTFGLCKMNFNGGAALPTFLFALIFICGAAVAATAVVWRNRPEEPRGFAVEARQP